MHRYARNRHDAHVPASCRASQHIVERDYTDNHAKLLQRNADTVNQADMLQQLAKLQKACNESVSACFVGKRGSMKLAGIIIHTRGGIVWADYDCVSNKMLSPRFIEGTELIKLRREIHRGGLVPMSNDASVTIRKVG